MKISRILVENSDFAIVDREAFLISFELESEEQNIILEGYKVAVIKEERTEVWNTGWVKSNQQQLVYQGQSLKPFSEYCLCIVAHTNKGHCIAEKKIYTGRLGTRWKGCFITDGKLKFSSKESPSPITFYKRIKITKKPRRILLSATALGNYVMFLNNQRIGNDCLSPGFTQYRKWLQYQMYDITKMLTEDNSLVVVLSGGWAAGVFGMRRRSKGIVNKPGFLAEIRIEYEDGRVEIIKTDSTWEIANRGNYISAGIYEGVVYDATIEIEKEQFRRSAEIRYPFRPLMVATCGKLPYLQEMLLPVEVHASKSKEGIIYNFGQNFSGIVKLQIKRAYVGQKIIVRHGEVLLEGELFTSNLRTAKAEVVYICKEGVQEFIPELTWMGFQYIRVSGIDPENINISAYVISSVGEAIGHFECSEQLINRLQRNIYWSGRSNMVDIPSDCPQRDERLGWTGDISIFASTACFNFDMSRILDKWLQDVNYEQGYGGSLPLVIPKTDRFLPKISIAGWCDCVTFVPWAEYMANGNIEMLKRQYPTMKKMVKAERFWSAFLSTGNNRYIFKGLFQFGDWLAPKGDIKDWSYKGKWIATAYFFQSCRITEKVARELGFEEEAKKFAELAEQIESAFRQVFTDGKGKLEYEFQSGYVCPIYFGMLSDKERQIMGARLNRLIIDNDYKLSTGFLGTPYLLFALADTGYIDTAYRVLLQEECPGWLYEVKAGGTTIWERWDALKEDGTVNLASALKGDGETSAKYDSEDQSAPSMTSFNHYANGAVGDFFYRRILGIEAIEPGYRRFCIKPVPGVRLTSAQGGVRCRYGYIHTAWKRENSIFKLDVQIPINTRCEVHMPNGECEYLGSGKYHFEMEDFRENQEDER